MLTLDADSEARIHALWQTLGEAGLPALAKSGWQPHITLAAFDTEDPVALHRALGTVFRRVTAFGLQIEGLGSFPARGILYAKPTVTGQLLSLQANLYAALSPFVTFGERFYAPDAWTPHCTLTLDASPRELGLAVELLAARWQPFTLRVEGVCLLRSPGGGVNLEGTEVAFKALRNPNTA